MKKPHIKTIVATLLLATLDGIGMFTITYMKKEAVPQKANKVQIIKSQRKLCLLASGKVIHTFRISMGPNPKGHKMFEGDGRTPEGVYTLDWRNEKSKFHKSIHISYPNDSDKQYAETHAKKPGGQIMVHGLPNGKSWLGYLHLLKNWTQGCIAVTNSEMDIIWQKVDDGIPIEILP